MTMENIKKKIQYNSPVILTFTFIALFIYILGWITKGYSTELLFTNYRTSFLDPLQYLRLFSHVFGHADWQHFAGNFTLILLIGPMVEEKYGSKTLIKLMFATAFVTGMFNTLFFSTGLLGASGIAFMLIILGSFVNVENGKLPLTFLIILFVFVGKEVLNAFILKDNISQFAHIAGGAVGSFFGYFLNRDN